MFLVAEWCRYLVVRVDLILKEDHLSLLGDDLSLVIHEVSTSVHSLAIYVFKYEFSLAIVSVAYDDEVSVFINVVFSNDFADLEV